MTSACGATVARGPEMFDARQLLSVLLALVAVSSVGYVGFVSTHGPQADEQHQATRGASIDATTVGPQIDNVDRSHALDDASVPSVSLDVGDIDGVVLPLAAIGAYSRFDDSSDPLEHDTRATIYETVTASPGIYLAQIAHQIGVELSTVRYHCRVLTDEGLLNRQSVGGHHCLFPQESRPSAEEQTDPELQAALRNDTKSEVLRAVYRHEPASVSTLAAELERADSTVSYHLDQLESRDLVERERDGREVRVQLTSPIRGTVDEVVAD